jgi:hypothetical protein
MKTILKDKSIIEIQEWIEDIEFKLKLISHEER